MRSASRSDRDRRQDRGDRRRRSPSADDYGDSKVVSVQLHIELISYKIPRNRRALAIASTALYGLPRMLASVAIKMFGLPNLFKQIVLPKHFL